MKRLVIINMSIGMTPSLTESVYINLRASWKLGRFEFGASSWKYHRNQQCVRVREARGARGATRPATSAVKVGRVAPRAPVVGQRWYLRDAPNFQTRSKICDPSRVETRTARNRGYRRATRSSTPGYLLAALRAALRAGVSSN